MGILKTLESACSEKCGCVKCKKNLDEWKKNCNLTTEEYYKYFQLSEFEIPVYNANKYIDDKIRKMAQIIYRKKFTKFLKNKKPEFIKLVINDLMKTFHDVKKELLERHMTNWYVLDKMERDGVIKCDYSQLRKDFLSRKYK